MLQHYDVIVVGGGLASRVAAPLLAKAGKRVLAFREPPRPFPGWFMPSLHLERLLQRLDGRSCITAPVPFQVLTRQSRLDIHGPVPFEEELRREFPAGCALLESRLQALRTLGESLEEMVWSAGGLPVLGWKSRWRFFSRRLRHGLRASALRRPLTSHFASLPDQHALTAMEALFAGLSLTPFDRLSVAEGALLWSCVCRAEGVSRSGLEELLRRRYGQYHGEEGDLSQVVALQMSKGSPALMLKSGQQLTAGHFLLGSPDVLARFPKDWAQRAPRQPVPVRLSTTAIEGGISPLLSSQVILGDSDPVLRLLFAASGERSTVLVDQAADAAPVRTELHRRLTEILPFTTFALEGGGEEPVIDQGGGKQGSTPFPGIQPLLLKENLLYLNGGDICPSLGTLGEVMIGLTVARHLAGEDAGRKV
jgi:hypothetical protein